ncbi:hypothetical protein CDG62_17330 [Acinetobacter sp. WCHA55]|nr:hypothetical protein CDG62_17330 [Acinetobacter sp. WCHA55]
MARLMVHPLKIREKIGSKYKDFRWEWQSFCAKYRIVILVITFRFVAELTFFLHDLFMAF